MRLLTSSFLTLFVFLASCNNSEEHANTGQDKYPDDREVMSSSDKDHTAHSNIEVKLTTSDATQKLMDQPSLLSDFNETLPNITISENEAYQVMDGFGFALTGGSAMHLNSMSNQAREVLLKELFGNGEGELGLSFIRVSIGASDLDEEPYSYSDTKDNVPDPELNTFSIAKDEVNLIPILKEILTINPDVNIMASPWSPPVWMKSNKSTIGGTLLPVYYDAYARYFVKYLQAMNTHGINIDFITIQNEPLHDGNNPSLYMTAAEQANFIGGHLGPAFEKADISTKILAYDHNVDRIDYPLDVLSNSLAKDYVYGSAFHLYGGDISDLSVVHSTFPDKHIYFTEQWYGAPGNFEEDLQWHIRNVVIGTIRNWSRGVIEWNLSSNPSLEPHTDGGCDRCLGAITIDGDHVTRNAGYYVIGHVSSFVPAGSRRISSTPYQHIPNVAFLTPENEIVLLVLNDTKKTQAFTVDNLETQFSVTMEPGSVATFKWKSK